MGAASGSFFFLSPIFNQVLSFLLPVSQLSVSSKPAHRFPIAILLDKVLGIAVLDDC